LTFFGGGIYSQFNFWAVWRLAPGLGKKPKKKEQGYLKQVGLLGTIPLLIGVGPLIGYFIGNWLDNKLETSPYLLILFLILGFGASVKETIRIIKVATREPDE
jgi:F0F1-type ATP synthase assembly protein I